MAIASYLSDSWALLGRVSPQPGVVAASVAAIVVVALAGRLLLPRSEPALAFGAGMGGLILVGTAFGVAGLDLRLGLLVIAVAAAACLIRDRRELGQWAGVGLPVLAMALPLLLLLSDRRGSEWDEFSHWLHAFRYVQVNHAVPGGPAVPVMATCCAAYPYGWPMVGLAAMTLSGFSEAVPALLNVLLLALFAMLLAGLARGEPSAGRLGPAAAAVALLAATVASPTFVHKLAFSAYADVATAFLAAVLALLGERVAGDGDRVSRHRLALAFGLVGAALMGVKPGNAALFGCILGAAGVLALRRDGWKGLFLLQWVFMVIPPALVSGLWRWHVDHLLAGREMVIQPMDRWHVAEIPQILLAMLDVAGNKGGYFGLALIMVVLGLRGFLRDRDRLDRLCVMAGLAFLGYNLFLLVTYVVVFGDYEALHVASYWRYNTHLGLVVMLPAAILVGRGLARVGHLAAARMAARLALVLVLAGPLLAVGQIRFDHDRTKPFLRQSLHQAGAMMPAGEHAVVIDPQGTGLAGVMASYEWSGRVTVDSFMSAFTRSEAPPWLDAQPAHWAFVYSGAAALGLEPVNSAFLLHREGSTWTVIDQFPFPGGKSPERWP
ncbi:conserved membrane protein of unknown function [Magnetospirillum sp. XM-1]|uniref:hypothetical protein n=1 Tax=Magnetospirillum sp. XM-1 TaxID=1663591 RepID=UPI00073DEF65|nr:hypothetical protein [Magnetospirillum sp. XM-1]CUW38076.1 conserved membrane protein of unknown function [Magnetospirillum sp. XM-1]